MLWKKRDYTVTKTIVTCSVLKVPIDTMGCRPGHLIRGGSVVMVLQQREGWRLITDDRAFDHLGRMETTPVTGVSVCGVQVRCDKINLLADLKNHVADTLP